MFDLHIRSQSVTTAFALRIDILKTVGATIRDLVADRGGVQVALITDERVRDLYGTTVVHSLESADLRTFVYAITAGEASKTLGVVSEIYRFLTEHRIGRDGIIIALGGGVVSDLAGFVAATWMRGVRFVICPTTLEADIDACLGGKTAINVPGAKNLVGAFHQPILVAVDPLCLKTLEPRDVRAGLAESIKHALISSAGFLAWHEANVKQILALDDACLGELIERNLRIKGAIVEQDPYEQTGLRMHLNFGHTMGHAIEECCGFRLRHGECVALGMLAACRLSREANLLDSSTVERVEALLRALGLPTQLPEAIETARVLATIGSDKKVHGGSQRFVLLEGIGKPAIRDDIPEDPVRRAYESLRP